MTEAMDQPSDYDQASFPESLYLAAFGDVAAAVARGQFASGFEHWSQYGREEILAGGRPSPFSLPPAASPAPTTAPPAAEEARFDEAIYLAVNPDVAAEVARGRLPSGLDHWRRTGHAEEAAGMRPSLLLDSLYPDAPPSPSSLSPAEAAGFDAATYLHLNPDVRASLGTDPAAALAHWLDHGRREGRAGPGVAAHARSRPRPGVMLARPFGLDVYGPLAATSGLGTAARGLVRAIEAAGIPFTLHPFDTSRGLPRITPAARAREPVHRVNLLLANADQTESLLALYPSDRFEDAFNIGVWAWELASFRSDWFGCFAPLDEVWTNSAFERDSIAAMAPLPVQLVPLPVEVTPVGRAEARARLGLPPDRFIVLLAFDAGSTAARKNPLAGVRAFREAFAPGEAFLVLKLHSAELDPTVTAELNAALRGAGDVLLIPERLDASRMAALQCACDCYLSPHRSEGFGLNLAEFLALGRPVVATGYSGSADFLDEDTGFPVPYDLVEIERQAGPYLPGATWAEPSHAALVARLREVRDHPEEARARAARGQALMQRSFSPEAVGVVIRDRLLALGLDAAPPPFLLQLGATRGLATPAALSGLDEAARAALAPLGASPPVLSLVVPVHDVPVFMIEACIASVRAQSYPFWELCVCDDASTDPAIARFLDGLHGSDPRIRLRRNARNLGISGASNAAAAMASGSFLLMLDDDDTLAPDALLEVARALHADPLIDALYCDEDKIAEDGTLCDHFHKPDWSPEHLESVMYVLHMLCVRKSLFLALGGFRDEYSGAQDYDLMLRVSRATTRIHHVPRILYHWRRRPGSAAATVDAKPRALENGHRALLDHALAKYGPDARVEPGLLPGTFRLRRPVRGTPPVTLVIPTANATADLPGRGPVRLIDNLLASILARTDYPNVHVLVADDARLLPEQRAHWISAGARVLDYPRGDGPFNYAAKCNWAVRQVETRHLVLLNDDMEVLGAGWLTALMELLADEEIGAVGGRLLHGDGTVQHVGMAIGVNGGSAHLYHSFPGEHVGYNGFTHVIRNYSAVTGACLATRREVLTRVGGFDEGFAVDFNDTDLCLRIREAGWRVAYTPYCELLHFEGRSAPRAAPAEHERLRFATRWRKYMEADPGYNVNLSRAHVDFRLRD